MTILHYFRTPAKLTAMSQSNLSAAFNVRHMKFLTAKGEYSQNFFISNLLSILLAQLTKCGIHQNYLFLLLKRIFQLFFLY